MKELIDTFLLVSQLLIKLIKNTISKIYKIKNKIIFLCLKLVKEVKCIQFFVQFSIILFNHQTIFQTHLTIVQLFVG